MTENALEKNTYKKCIEAFSILISNSAGGTCHVI